MSNNKLERKWIIGIETRFGPTEELVRLIPRIFPDDDDWYFVRSLNGAVPATRVFDTAEDAAIGAIRANEVRIGWIEKENARLRQWLQNLRATQEEAVQATG